MVCNDPFAREVGHGFLVENRMDEWPGLALLATAVTAASGLLKGMDCGSQETLSGCA